jgi:hypothetical protein
MSATVLARLAQNPVVIKKSLICMEYILFARALLLPDSRVPSQSSLFG